jgi:chromosome partitioning protein
VQQILAVVNEKGGTGKTTTTVNVAAAFAERGLHVLVVDLDPQGAASAWLGVHEPDDSLADALIEDASLATAVVPSNVGGVEVIGATRRLVAAEVHLAREPGGNGILRQALAGLPSGRWDLVILDCPPTLGQLSVAALTAATHVLVPVEATIGASRALPQILKTVESMRARVNPSLEIVGLALIRFESTRHAREVASLLNRRFADLLLPQVVRKTVRLQDAQLYSQPITSYDSRCSGAEDYRALAAAILERLSVGAQAVAGAR